MARAARQDVQHDTGLEALILPTELRTRSNTYNIPIQGVAKVS